jgi:HK97 family phage portal protein
VAASTSLVRRALGAVSRVWRPPVSKALIGGNYWLPITGGFLPGDAPWNWWQLGYNPAGIGQSAVVSACIAAYAQTTAMCPGTHWRSTDDGGRERVANSALSRVLKRPNAYQSISDFLLNLVHNLYAEGNAYALAIRNNRYEVAELHLMNPRMSMPMIAVNGDIYYGLGGNFVVDKLVPSELLSRAPARDVLHIKLDSRPENPLIGEPPLISALLDVAASDAMVRQALAYTNNSGRPSGVIQTDMQLDEQQTRELRAAWDEQTKGANAGGTPILTWGLKWQQVAPTSRDAQIAELLQISDQRIATAFRMPLALLSLVSGQAPQASTEGLIQFWLANGLGFALAHIEEGIGRFFGLDGLPDEYLEFDTRALLRSNLRDRIEALARGVQGGIYSPNEARALEDLPAAEDGDEPRVQQQVVPLSFGAKPPPAPAPQPQLPPPSNAGDGQETDAAKFADSIIRAADQIRDGRRDAA